MKLNLLKASLILSAGFLTAGCEFDNFEEPTSTLSGRIVYQGEPLGLRSKGVELELWQPGYELFQKIPVHVDQDGSFSAVLFNGDYKLTLLRGNGPWLDSSDSIDVQVRGGQILDVEVEPYYILSQPTYSVIDNKMTVNFVVEEVNAEREIETLAIYMGRTSITDAVRNEGAVIIPSEDIVTGTPISVEVAIPSTLSGRSTLFARVGVKASGVQELLYSQVAHVNIE